ncbi:MAG: mechanosensitive ion channel family protein [Candidatus Thorarchaeota archaeon]
MQVAPDFFVDPIEFIQFYWDAIFPYLILIIQLIVLFLIYKVVLFFVKRSLITVGMGTEASSGVSLVLKLVFFIFAVVMLVEFMDSDFGTLLSLTALFGTALGLAFSQALGNIVSGLYVVVARPFRVGDYIRIGSIEGVVTEITLNYTRILLQDETYQLVPNSKAVSSEATNFRIDISEFLEAKLEAKEAAEGRSRKRYKRAIDVAWKGLKDIADDDDAYRYTFDLTLHMSRDHAEATKLFDEVCEEWEPKFVAKPEYIIWAKPSNAITYRFSFIVKSALLINRYTPDFKKALLATHFQPKS